VSLEGGLVLADARDGDGLAEAAGLLDLAGRDRPSATRASVSK